MGKLSNFKKLLMAGTAVVAVTVLVMPISVHAATVVVNGADVVVVADPLATPAIDFQTANIATVNAGILITGTVTSTADLQGILTFSGASTVSGAVGAVNKALSTINAGVAAVTFGSNVNSGIVNITGASTVSFNGNVTGNINLGTNDGIVSIANNKSIIGTVDTGSLELGTLTLLGSSNVSGTVGSAAQIKVINAGALGSSSSFSGAVNATTINITSSGAVTFNSTVNSTSINVTSLNFLGAGTVTFNNTVTFTNALDFNNNDATVILGSGVTITKSIDNTGVTNNLGTLTLAGGTQIINSNIGATRSLKVVNAGANGATSVFNNTVNAATINITGTGSVTFSGAVSSTSSIKFLGAGSLVFNATASGAVDFADKDGVLALSNNINLANNVDNTIGLGSMGTLNLSGGTQTITGNVGATKSLKVVNLGATGGVSTITGTTNAVNINATGTGAVTLTGAVTGIVAMGTASAATFGSSVIGDVSYGGAGALTIGSFLTGNLTITGSGTTGVTGAITGIVALGLSGNATFGSSVTGDISYAGVGTVSIGSFLTGNLTISAAGTATVTGLTTGNVTMATGSTGTFTGGVTGAVSLTGSTANFGALVTGDVTLAGVSTATFNNALIGNLSFTGDSTAILTSGDLTGAVSTSVANNGTLTLSAGAAQTVSGTVGATNSLKVVNAGANAATSNFSADVVTQNFNLTGTGIINFNGNLKGALNYKAAGGTVNLADGMNISGATAVTTDATGKLTLLGSSTMPGTIGSAGLSLGTLEAGATGSTSSFSSDVYATNFSSTGTGSTTFNGALKAASINFNAVASTTGAITFNGDVSGSIDGNSGVIGAGIGNVTFSTNASAVTSIGTTGILKTLSLTGNATTVSVTGGNIKGADTTSIGNNILSATAGSFTMGAGQTLNINILGATSGQVVSSVAPVLNATSNVLLSIDTNAYVPDNQSFTLVDDLTNAGGGIPTVDFTASNTSMITFTQDTANTNDLIVTSTRKALNTFATGVNAIRVANAMDLLGMNGDATLDTIQLNLQTAGNAGNSAQVTSILDSLVSNADGGVTSSNLSLGSLTQGINEGRIATIRLGGEDYYNSDTQFTGLSAGNPVAPNGYTAWFQGYGDSSVQDSYNAYSGYKSNIYGTVFGIDTTEVFEDTVFGVSFSVGQTQVKSKNANSTQSDISNYGISLYSNYDFNNFMFMDTQIGLGYNSVDSRRFNVGGTGGSTARANYNTIQYQAKSILGADLWIPSGLIITPTLSAAYTFLYSESYIESGAVGASLDIAGQRMAILDLGGGIDLAYKMQNAEDGSFLKPIIHASYTYDAIGDTLQTDAKFTGGGTSFSTFGTPISRSRFNGGLGIVYASPSLWAVSLNYDYEYRNHFSANSGSLRLTGSF